MWGKSVRSMTHTQTPVKVLKIIGLAHSGSTVLDVVLGNHPSIESVGEVNKLVRTGWISRESLRGIDPKRLRRPVCTCGKRLDVLYVDAPEEACPFWSRVRREWVQRVDPRDDIEGYPRLQDDFELKRRWPRLLREARRGPSARFRSYARLTRAFFEAISAASGKPVVVDSTMVSVRTFALSMVPGIDLRVVHLVRDGRGVVASHRKSFEKDLLLAAGERGGLPARWKAAARRRVLYPESVVRWVAHNLISGWVCARLGEGRAMRLRYEDFVADPEAALGRIGSLVGLDLAGVAKAASSGEPMRAGHNIGGNRTKRSGHVTLRPDAQEWREALSPAERRLSWALMGWLMRRYGYAAATHSGAKDNRR
jgi:Sulfotransferase family